MNTKGWSYIKAYPILDRSETMKSLNPIYKQTKKKKIKVK